MPLRRIPEKYRPGLAKIITLSDESVRELLTVLSETPPTVNPKVLTEELSAKVKTISASDMKNIVLTLFSLYVSKSDEEVATPKFVANLIKLMEESENKDLKLTDENRDNVRQRLTELLDFDSLGIGGKALDVMTEHEHIVCSFRVLTDIRPVFGLDLEAPPVAAVVVHTLKISYHYGSQLKEFFVAMDTNDVNELRELLNRADLKSKNLQTILGVAKVPYLDVKHGD